MPYAPKWEVTGKREGDVVNVNNPQHKITVPLHNVAISFQIPLKIAGFAYFTIT
jgi:hypothetical protein